MVEWGWIPGLEFECLWWWHRRQCHSQGYYLEQSMEDVGVPVDVLSGPWAAAPGTEVAHTWFVVVMSSWKFISSCLTSACGALSDPGGKRAAEHNLSPSKGLGSQILILTDAKSGGREESSNISWERWSHILKETTNQLVRANKMCKMAGSSPIHR